MVYSSMYILRFKIKEVKVAGKRVHSKERFLIYEELSYVRNTFAVSTSSRSKYAALFLKKLVDKSSKCASRR